MNERKRNLLVFIIILVVLLGIAFIIFYFVNPQSYRNRQIKQTTINTNTTDESFSENNSIELEDLSVGLSSVRYSPNGEDQSDDPNSMLDFVVDFTSKTESGLNLVRFDYLVFDQENRILNSSLWGNLKNTKKYIVGFLDEKYGQKQFYHFNDHCIFTTSSLHDNITGDLKKVSKTITSSLNEPLINPKQINVRLINLEYQFENTTLTSPLTTDLEFMLKFN